MLITAIRKEKKKWHESGKVERSSEIIKNMLLENADPAFISKVTGLSIEKIMELKRTLFEN